MRKLPRNDYPQWLKNADISKEVIYKNENGIIVWECGIWKNGFRKNGIWESGVWGGGVWEFGSKKTYEHP